MATRKQLKSLAKARKVRKHKVMAKKLRSGGYKVAKITRTYRTRARKVVRRPVRRTVKTIAIRRIPTQHHLQGGSFMSVLGAINEGLKAIKPVSIFKKIVGQDRWDKWSKGKVGKYLMPIADAGIRAGYGSSFSRGYALVGKGPAHRASKRLVHRKHPHRTTYRRKINGRGFLDKLKKVNEIAKIIKPVSMLKTMAGQDRWDKWSNGRVGKYLVPVANLGIKAGYGRSGGMLFAPSMMFHNRKMFPIKRAMMY